MLTLDAPVKVKVPLAEVTVPVCAVPAQVVLVEVIVPLIVPKSGSSALFCARSGTGQFGVHTVGGSVAVLVPP